jgi:hypothetical protein
MHMKGQMLMLSRGPLALASLAQAAHARVAWKVEANGWGTGKKIGEEEQVLLRHITAC